MNQRSGEDRRKTYTMLDPSKERRSGKDRRVEDQIKKLKIDNGDIIIFRIREMSKTDFAKKTVVELSKFVRDQGGILIFASTEMKVEKFNEKQMNKMGWYRKKKYGDTG